MVNLRCVLARNLYMRPYYLMARPDHSWPKLYYSKPVFVKGLFILRLCAFRNLYVGHRKRPRKYFVNLVEKYVIISEDWCLMLCNVELCSFGALLCRKVDAWCLVMPNCVNVLRCGDERYIVDFYVDWCVWDIYSFRGNWGRCFLVQSAPLNEWSKSEHVARYPLK